jgi:N6-adenosine-specific RNA methylase IME4
MPIDFKKDDLRAYGTGFQTVVADPAWSFRTKGPIGSGGRGKEDVVRNRGSQVATQNHYETMSIEEIAAMNVKDIVAKNAHLYLWIPNAFLADVTAPGPRICLAWGFRPVTIITWAKHCKGDPSRPSPRTGFYFRGASEQIIFAVRGSLPLQTRDAIPTWFGTERFAHSVKPDAFFDMVERASPSPRVELFSRKPRDGWTVLGNEVTDAE